MAYVEFIDIAGNYDHVVDIVSTLKIQGALVRKDSFTRMLCLMPGLVDDPDEKHPTPVHRVYLQSFDDYDRFGKCLIKDHFPGNQQVLGG